MAKKGRKKKRKKKVTLPWWAAMLVATGMMAAIIIPLACIGIGERGAVIPAAARGELGIDISHHNGSGIIWDSLRVMTDRNGVTVKRIGDASDIRRIGFVFIKATEGASMRDRQFRENWENAAQSGIRRGAYHFYRSSKDPLVQAENFIRTVGEIRMSDLPPVLDIETVHRGCGREKLNADLRTWLKAVGEHYGRKPMIYCSDSFAMDNLERDLLDEYPLWIARYSEKRPARDDWEYWQFTDRAIVYGIRGKTDLSVRRSAGRKR